MAIKIIELIILFLLILSTSVNLIYGFVNLIVTFYKCPINYIEIYTRTNMLCIQNETLNNLNQQNLIINAEAYDKKSTGLSHFLSGILFLIITILFVRERRRNEEQIGI